VTAVAIYQNSAQVTRSAEVTLKQGVNEVVFQNIPENLDESTINVSAQGVKARILDAKIKRIFLEKPVSENVTRIKDEIQALEDQASAENSALSVINEERKFLDSIKLFAGNQIPKDLVTKMPTADELKMTDDFIKEKWEDTFARELEIGKKLRDLNRKIEKLRNELGQLESGAGRKEKRVLSIEFDAEKEGTLTVSASYLMYQANWYPEYDARVNYESGKVEITCLGVVRQTGGEDWQGVDITLSTAKPTISGRMPELSSWVLNPVETLKYDKLQSVKVLRKVAASAPLTEIGSAVNDGAITADYAEYSYAQTDEKLTSIEYKIQRKSDIKTDGSMVKLPVFSREFSADFEYYSTPKLSPYAYLVAKVKNEDEQMMPANVRIFFGDTYVGSSRIDAVGKGESIDLYLGIDEGVKVKREKVKEETKDVWFAGIERPTKTVIISYKITAENYKGKSIKLNIFDQVPVAGTNKIAVKMLDINLKPNDENYKDRKGVMRWLLGMQSKDKKEIAFTYQVELPQEMSI